MKDLEWSVRQISWVGLVIMLLFVSTSVTRGQTMQLPAGFVAESVIAQGAIYAPVDMAFLPSGEIFVLQKGNGLGQSSIGAVRIISNGVAQNSAVLVLGVNSQRDSGALALAIDPDFDSNHFFYIWYAAGENAPNWTGVTKMRLSRFTYNPETKSADSNTERILLETERWTDDHEGNSLIFDKDGNLFLGIGEMRTTDRNGPQDMRQWYGKVIKIRPTLAGGYTIPADNPFVQTPSARPEIYALGFRNPYRMAIRQSDGLHVLGDVGHHTWEEINHLQPGANYGWPLREGPCPREQYRPCPAAEPRFTDPIVAYDHKSGPGAAITGMAFYEGEKYPAQYRGQLFFSDYARGFVATSDPTTGWYQPFASNAGAIVDIEYHNGYLYMLDLVDNNILKLNYLGGVNQAPSVNLFADKMSGKPPLTVTFRADGRDNDGWIKQYKWDFGDGTQQVSNSPTMKHTYTRDGLFTASVSVVDDKGLESGKAEREISVFSAEMPRIELTNLTDASQQLYRGGDRIQYRAVRSSNAGLDPAKPYEWTVIFHHNVHIHPFSSDQFSDSGILAIPTENHDGDSDVWYEIILTMHTDTGQTVTVRRDVRPKLVNLTFKTIPGSAPLQINGVEKQSPTVLNSIVGVENKVEAPADINENQFIEWRWGTQTSGQRALFFRAPAFATTYTAHYQGGTPPQPQPTTPPQPQPQPTPTSPTTPPPPTNPPPAPAPFPDTFEFPSVGPIGAGPVGKNIWNVTIWSDELGKWVEQ